MAGTTMEDTVRQELQEAYAHAGQAFKAKDAAAVMQKVAPGFMQRMPDGTLIDAVEAEAAMREWFATADTVTRYAVQIGALTVQGDNAVAEVTEDVAMTFADPKGKAHERVQANTSEVTWVRTADGWR